MFESLGAFGFGREDEGIETGLVDEDSLGTCSWNHSPESGYWFYFLCLHGCYYVFRVSCIPNKKLLSTQYSLKL